MTLNPRPFLAVVLGWLLTVTAGFSQVSDDGESSQLMRDPATGAYRFTWWGQSGRTYFLQQSEDLVHWIYVPVIESGADQAIAWGFTSTAANFFVRLKYSDFLTDDPFNADFDGDQVSNYDELLQGTDPFQNYDSDGSGLPDDWQIKHFGHLGVAPGADADGDGLANLQELQYGTDPNNADTDGDGVSDGQEILQGTSPTKSDSNGDGIPDGFTFSFQTKLAVVELFKDGYPGFSAPNLPLADWYLTSTTTWQDLPHPTPGDPTAGPGKRIDTYDPLHDTRAKTLTGNGDWHLDIFNDFFHAQSSASATGTADAYKYAANGASTLLGQVGCAVALSNPYTTDLLRQSAAGRIESYPAAYTTEYLGDPYQYTNETEEYYNYEKMTYKFVFGKKLHKATSRWAEVFQASYDPSGFFSEVVGREWTGQDVSETGSYEIDPYAIDPALEGDWAVMWVDSVEVDGADPETHKIPSNQYASGVWGKDHFVCVKNTGDIVLRAHFNGHSAIVGFGPERITWECDNATIVSPAVAGSRLTAKLSSAEAGKYVVKMKVDGNLMWEGVVWVVWCDLTSVRTGKSDFYRDNYFEDVPSDSFEALGLLNDRFESNDGIRGYESAAAIQWNGTIQPATIITDDDRPAIEGQRRQRPPGSSDLVNGVPATGLKDATGKEFSGWDISRQVRIRCFYGIDQLIFAPVENNTDLGPLSAAISNAIRPRDIPTDATIGNDDTSCFEEDDDPYDGTIGIIKSFDRPTYAIEDKANYFNAPNSGESGDFIRLRQRFHEFVRVQLGSIWYRCSDATAGIWRFDRALKRTQNTWNADPERPSKFDLTDPEPFNFDDP